ncbi:response regulator [Ancylobacter sp. Lp-2]|uniref:hybrid sensor histidine kinase/response regulator n=1 Tax=Ancylobacter sp. Lp-2 TaxID=2881339 RepID=UPI001E5C1200|nr:hybrid sensor histidine kinase/response regulator [Ancylobacter sp. Lp-2]MCB4771986.1 response regulator [Ancylobacter sp. Lp-2]
MSVGSSFLEAIAKPFRWMVGRLRNRPDSEHEMSFNRLVFACIIVVVLLVNRNSSDVGDALRVMALYMPLALGVLGHIILFPGISRGRRLFSLLLDCGFLSWQLHLGGEIASLFFPIYLWVIFGNGFRFGLSQLAIAIPVATLCFAAVVWTTPYWHEQWHLSAGLLIGLVILPAYSGTLIRKLSQATKVAEEASQAKSLFLASVSHELRTPLTAIVGMTGLLRGTPLVPEQREMVETVDVATHSLRSLIDGLLDLSRIEAGRMPVPEGPFDLLALLLDARRLVESQARERGLSFDIHVTPRTPLYLSGSRQHLHEVLINLVGNAVKFTHQGRVTLAVDAEPEEGGSLRLTVEVSDTGIGIALADQARIFEDFTQADPSILNRFGGSGLGLSIVRRLVDLMGGTIAVESEPGMGSTFRLHVPVLPVSDDDLVGEEPWRDQGVALVCRDVSPLTSFLAALSSLGITPIIVDPRLGPTRMFPPEAMGAVRMLFEPDTRLLAFPAPSSPGSSRPLLIRPGACAGLSDMETRRSCVSLLGDSPDGAELRRALTVACRIAARSTGQVTEPPQPLASQPRHLLLADDNRINQKVFRRILEGAGHSVLVVESGEQALDMLVERADEIDLVLMDFNMPDTDGLEASKLYRMMATGADRLPIVGLTADATAQGDQRWRQAGMDACLIKPIEPSALLAAVDRLARRTDAAWTPVLRLADAREVAMPALDDRAIESLRQLGGARFATELMEDYLLDAEVILRRLVETAERGDLLAFRNEAHALQSSSANVGALALGTFCMPWRELRAQELRAGAAELQRQAGEELHRTRDVMRACSERMLGLG